MFHLTTLSVLLACAAATAQAPAAAPRIGAEVGRATARGGDCERIVMARDGKHMVTVGEAGDLLWWDLPQRRLLRRVEGMGKYVTALTLHPTEPWAVIGSCSGGWEGVAWRCDFETGATRVLRPNYTKAVSFDASGQQLCVELRIEGAPDPTVAYRSASLRGEQPLEEIPGDVASVARLAEPSCQVQSFDGRHQVHCQRDKVISRVSRRGADPREYLLADSVETWIDHCAVADDGTIVAADLQGQLHVLGAASDEHTLLAGHAGDAHQLVFSPDGRFLAVAGLGACRVVDLTGKAVAEWWGTRIVTPGPEGADFWSFGRGELRRWSASMQGDVVPPFRWGTPALCVTRGTGQGMWRSSDDDAPFHLWTVGAASVVGDAPWLGTDDFRRANAWRFANGAFERVGVEWSTEVDWPVSMVALVACADGHMLGVAGRQGGSLTRSRSFAILWDQSGASVAKWEGPGFPEWVVADPASSTVVLGLNSDVVLALSADTLTKISERNFERKSLPQHGVFFDRGRILAAIGAELVLLDARSLETLGTMSLPADIGRIDAVGVSRDRRHVAVAHRSDVRILRLE